MLCIYNKSYIRMYTSHVLSLRSQPQLTMNRACTPCEGRLQLKAGQHRFSRRLHLAHLTRGSILLRLNLSEGNVLGI